MMLLLFMQLPAIAQIRQLFLKTIDGEPVKYITVSCEKRQLYIMSDANGCLWIDPERCQFCDTLTFRSIFYQELKMSFGELLKRKELVLLPMMVVLEDVSVYPASVAENLVKEMAIIFSQNYAENYASSVIHLRTLKSNERYREFTGLQGIFFSVNFNQSNKKLYFEDKNSLNWLPISVMRSDPFVTINNKVLPKCAVFLPPGSQVQMFSKESMKIEYHDYPDQHALVMKRALEIFSPLNPTHLKNFSYSVNSSYKRGDDKIYVINFETKDQAFPKHTKIYGKGIFYYNVTTKLVEKVVMENHQDQYSMFPRWKVRKLLPSATHHVIEVTYCCQDKQIFTKSIKLNVEWIDPQVEANFYMVTLNPRRNPIKNNLKELEYYEFDKFIVLDKSKKRQVMPYLALNAWDKFYYVAPFDLKAWTKMKWGDIDKEKLFRELSLPDRSLIQQAEKNGLDMQFRYDVDQGEFYNMIRNLYRRVPRVLKIIHEDRE